MNRRQLAVEMDLLVGQLLADPRLEQLEAEPDLDSTGDANILDTMDRAQSVGPSLSTELFNEYANRAFQTTKAAGARYGSDFFRAGFLFAALLARRGLIG